MRRRWGPPLLYSGAPCPGLFGLRAVCGGAHDLSMSPLPFRGTSWRESTVSRQVLPQPQLSANETERPCRWRWGGAMVGASFSQPLEAGGGCPAQSLRSTAQGVSRAVAAFGEAVRRFRSAVQCLGGSGLRFGESVPGFGSPVVAFRQRWATIRLACTASQERSDAVSATPCRVSEMLILPSAGRERVRKLIFR
jgi:hypothetical protein